MFTVILKMMRKKTSGAFAFFFLFSMVLAVNADAASMASHQAIYELDLKSTTAAAEINSVSGKVHYSIKKVCDGWATSENYAISFGSEKGENVNFISHYKTWESDGNTSFIFEIVENSNASGETSYEGFANQQNGKVEAFHSDGDGSMRQLPDDTVFPLQHMINLLEDAESSTPIIKQSHLFFGGEVSDSLYFISVVMGEKKPATPEKALAKTMGDLAESEFWPLSIAYYEPQSKNAEPAYSISFQLQPNGIIRGYVVDYGTFSMRASLKTLEPIIPEDCG